MQKKKGEKAMKVKITVHAKKASDIKVIEQPTMITIEFTKERANIYQKYGDEALLRSCCEQIIQRNFPHEHFEILNIETNHYKKQKEVQP
jgi:hypothetical protein